MRKIFKTRFSNKLKADKFLLDSGYRFDGRHGFIKTFHRYIGIQSLPALSTSGSKTNRVVLEKFEAHLFADGTLSIFVPSRSPLLGISRIPSPVNKKAPDFTEWKVWLPINKLLYQYNS
ncbi:hypothetical protein VIN01S_02240 [Vibrio inusitatus NBRC 102082]|uniref:Uncharacterized protein n=1 Tax=Vibrio inusitatus NBRC 102082 TaxID=1219070 RepID=A0A4Y3HRK5_9VIBR|nr:hypothetical protein [Vibrio inusitatus]GEA49420.1 hypothetical protein VIN01S_02240 [Vibrio inusitatus NBRC 102082]